MLQTRSVSPTPLVVHPVAISDVDADAEQVPTEGHGQQTADNGGPMNPKCDTKRRREYGGCVPTTLVGAGNPLVLSSGDLLEHVMST